MGEISNPNLHQTLQLPDTQKGGQPLNSRHDRLSPFPDMRKSRLHHFSYRKTYSEFVLLLFQNNRRILHSSDVSDRKK